MIARGLRQVVVLGAVATLAACSSSGRSAPAVPSTTAAATTTTTTRTPPALQAVVDRFVAGQTVDFSVVAVDFGSGVRAEHLADRVVLSASLYKLFVAAELLRRIDDGALDGSAPSGDATGRAVGECIDAMVVASDNACGEAGLAMVGFGRLDSALHADGYPSTSLAEPQQTSADDVARFLERARDGTLLGAGHERSTRHLYDLLGAQEVDDRLPMGLPPGTPIAHKTGDRRQWAHDAGVITTPRGDVLLVVLSGPWPPPCCDAEHPGPAEAEAFGAIAELGAAIYAAG